MRENQLAVELVPKLPLRLRGARRMPSDHRSGKPPATLRGGSKKTHVGRDRNKLRQFWQVPIFTKFARRFGPRKTIERSHSSTRPGDLHRRLLVRRSYRARSSRSLKWDDYVGR